VIRTTGDAISRPPLAESVEKAFHKEIEEALLAGRSIWRCIPPRTCRPHYLTGSRSTAVFCRAKIHVMFSSAVRPGFAELKVGAVVGTASLRRQAQGQAATAGPQVAFISGQCRDTSAQTR